MTSKTARKECKCRTNLGLRKTFTRFETSWNFREFPKILLHCNGGKRRHRFKDISCSIYFTQYHRRRKLRRQILGDTQGMVLLTSILGLTNSIKLANSSKSEPQFGQIFTAFGIKNSFGR
jgi:hypothetical protein